MSNLTAQSWLASFRKHFSKVDLKNTNDGAWEWSQTMSGVLHNVRSDFALWCKCKLAGDGTGHGKAVQRRNLTKVGAENEFGSDGEFLSIDMMWFEPGGAAHDYDPPLMALEHENNHRDIDAMADFWKVLQVAAPLRIFIGYTRESRVPGLVDELARLRWDGGRDRCHSLPGGEDIALVGGYQMKGWESWSGRVWAGGKMHTLKDFMRSQV